ncbi:MAG TPA: aldo/keto reductase [Planctomycetota bacterium]|nr:aldo/keto reductase [Planctomycetota bacterium]
MQSLPRRKLGRTGVEVTVLGLGGEGVLRTVGRAREAVAVIRRAVELGISYCDCAHAYAGSEDYYGEALAGGLRDRVFLTSKSAERDRAGAERDLETTLRRMKTDRLDLWQVHDVRTEGDLAEIFGRGGAIEAFAAAKKAGKVRFLGVTGHHDPAILTKAIELYGFDTVLMPVNAAEPHHRSFLDETLPLAVSKGMGVIGMKVLRGFIYEGGPRTDLHPDLVRRGLNVSRLLRFAFSQPISTAIVGCETVAQVEENVAIAKVANPLDAGERSDLVERTLPFARTALSYKGTW